MRAQTTCSVTSETWGECVLPIVGVLVGTAGKGLLRLCLVTQSFLVSSWLVWLPGSCRTPN